MTQSPAESWPGAYRALAVRLSGETVKSIDGMYDESTQYLPDGIPTDRAVINYTLDKPVIERVGRSPPSQACLIGSTVMHRLTTYQTDAGSFTFDARSWGISVHCRRACISENKH